MNKHFKPMNPIEYAGIIIGLLITGIGTGRSNIGVWLLGWIITISFALCGYVFWKKYYRKEAL